MNLDMLAKAVIPSNKPLIWTQQLTGQLVAIAIDDTKFSFAYDIEIVYEYRTEGTKSWGEIANIATIKLNNL